MLYSQLLSTRLVLLLSLILVLESYAFTSQFRPFHLVRLSMKPDEPDFDDMPPLGEDAEYTGSVDWDAEWKKVVENKGQPANRPKDIVKSDAEIAVTKTVNKAAQNLVDATSGMSVPSMDSLKGDWKFWIGILVVISIGTSLIAASGQGSQEMVQDSYYI